MNRWLVLGVLAMAMVGAGLARAGESKTIQLFDFETPADLSAWKLNLPDQDRLELSRRFVTQGERSVVWTTPRWKPGMEQWPQWVTAPAVKDWRGYDRIVIDLTNPTDSTALIRFKAVDSQMAKISSGLWPGGSVSIPPRSARREIVPLDTWMSGVDRSDISVFVFYTARAEGDVEIYIDNVMLLSPGSTPPPLPNKFLRELATMKVEQGALPDALRAVDEVEKSMADNRRSPEVTQWASSRRQELAGTIQQAKKELAGGNWTLDRIDELAHEVIRAGQRGHRLVSLLKLADQIGPQAGREGYLLGVAPAAEKILPRDMPVRLEGGAKVQLSLARNERESFQVAVLPLDSPLRGVHLETSDLKGDGQAVLKAGDIDVRVVGFVKTSRPEYAVDYVGWWPDPLLDFLPKVDVEPSDAQSFWVRIKAPKDQPAGTYRGKIRVVMENKPAAEVELCVRVYGFDLPDRSPLPLAMTTAGESFFAKYTSQDWNQFKFKYADFLADYDLTYDDLYRHGPPDMEIIKYLRDKGTLGWFNLGTLDYTVLTPRLDEAQRQEQIQKLIAELRPGYEAAKAAGVLDRAYIYGFDEVIADYIPLMKQVTAALKREFPGVKLMTTALAADWGPQSGLTDWDIWVPVLTDYNPQRASQVRSEGRQVWWYTCQSPAHPYPNLFTEYPAVEIRLLPGVMTFKMGSQGFLYYGTLRDEGPPRKTVDSGPFTQWDARCFRQPYNGEGYLIYPGMDGNPLASIRLENFRDGIEDYGYLTILRDRVAELKQLPPSNLSATQRNWLNQAETLLVVPDDLVKSPYEYSDNPRILMDYRDRVGGLIEAANQQ
jgi:hypothetical protein